MTNTKIKATNEDVECMLNFIKNAVKYHAELVSLGLKERVGMSECGIKIDNKTKKQNEQHKNQRKGFERK